MNDIKLLYFQRIYVSKGISAYKAAASKQFGICHYWYILEKGFKFQLNICNICRDLLMMSMNLSDAAISNIQGADYC